MKRRRNLWNRCFSNHKRREVIKKVDDLKKEHSYEETLKELEELLEESENENRMLKNQFWDEVRDGSSLTRIKDKVMEGWSPNDLECERIGILRL